MLWLYLEDQAVLSGFLDLILELELLANVHLAYHDTVKRQHVKTRVGVAGALHIAVVNVVKLLRWHLDSHSFPIVGEVSGCLIESASARGVVCPFGVRGVKGKQQSWGLLLLLVNTHHTKGSGIGGLVYSMSSHKHSKLIYLFLQLTEAWGERP